MEPVHSSQVYHLYGKPTEQTTQGLRSCLGVCLFDPFPTAALTCLQQWQVEIVTGQSRLDSDSAPNRPATSFPALHCIAGPDINITLKLESGKES